MRAVIIHFGIDGQAKRVSVGSWFKEDEAYYEENSLVVEDGETVIEVGESYGWQENLPVFDLHKDVVVCRQLAVK